jgi:hypothetical protein
MTAQERDGRALEDSDWSYQHMELSEFLCPLADGPINRNSVCAIAVSKKETSWNTNAALDCKCRFRRRDASQLATV